MKTFDWILLIAIIIGLSFIIFGTYSFFYGNPISQYKFKKEANQYLETTYPNLESRIIKVEYSFKESAMERQYFRANIYFNDNKKDLYSVFIDGNGIMTDSFSTRSRKVRMTRTLSE